MQVRWARLVSFAGCAALVALSAVVPAMERGPLLLIALVLVGAGSLGAHPQYYALVQELPAAAHGRAVRRPGRDIVGRGRATCRGRWATTSSETGSYDLPLIVTGLAPLAGLVAMAAWVALRSGWPSANAG